MAPVRRGKQTVDIVRAYDAPRPDGRFRVLVDRLWPRGLKKESLHLDLWLKDIAPSTSLRKWFNHDPERWDEFRLRYSAELAEKDELTVELLKAAREKGILLIFGAGDVRHNNAVVLREYLLNQIPEKKGQR